MDDPHENGTSEALAAAISKAMRALKPADKTANSWLLRLADEIGRHENSVIGWYYAERPPDGPGYWLLARALGPGFHTAVTTAMTGWTEGQQLAELRRELERVRGHLRAGLEEGT